MTYSEINMVTIILLSIILFISLLINFNQMRKQEALESYIEELENSNMEYYQFFTTLKSRMNESQSKLKQIDRMGSFEADDETGFIFSELRDMVDELNKGF